MAAGILVGAVRLDLDEPRRDAVADENLVQQLGRDFDSIPVVERAA
jgi:hypothetical protein